MIDRRTVKKTEFSPDIRWMPSLYYDPEDGARITMRTVQDWRGPEDPRVYNGMFCSGTYLADALVWERCRSCCPCQGGVMERKTPDEWLKDKRFAYCIRVLDPDGWDRTNYDEDWARSLTEDDMHGKLMRSTIEFDAGRITAAHKILCVSISPLGDPENAYVCRADEPFEWIFDGAEEGDGYTVELVGMTQLELDTLPEFEGF